MKLIAGSILAGFGLLATVLGHIARASLVSFGILVTVLEHSDPSLPAALYRALQTVFPAPIEILAILFIASGIGLIGWAIWENVKKRE